MTTSGASDSSRTSVFLLVNDDGTTANGFLIDEIAREGARRMLAAALKAEVNARIAELADQRDGTGRRLVVRNGYAQPRQVTTAAGAVEVKAPRVNDKHVDDATGERKRFSSAISPRPSAGRRPQPPWCRRSPKISEVLPPLYLHGLSSGDFVPALEQFPGSSAGLSPATVTRLAQQWQADHAAFMDRDLAEVDYVYVWADGIHLNVRLEEAEACVLVLIGVRADGSKELVALQDGYRESGESWADLPRDCARRGLRATLLAVGTVPWASGRRWPRCSPKPASSGAGCTQSGQWPGRHAEVRAARREEGHPGHLQRRRPRPRRGGDHHVRPAPRREVPPGRQEDHRRPGRAVGAPRIPGRAPDPSADQGHPRRRLARRRPWPWSSSSPSPPSSGGGP